MDREQLMLDRLLLLAEKTDIKNPYKLNYNITKKTDVWFVLLPQWSHFLPPFNLARLSSVLLEDGFYTRCMDLNIKSWNLTRPLLDEIGYDPWDGSRAFKWHGDLYFQELHPYFERLFNTSIEAIVQSNPKVIGFTLYWTNTIPAIWMKNKLKELLPDTIFLAGGPSTLSDLDSIKSEFDIIVLGEAEKIIIDVLNKIENDLLNYEEFPLILTQPSNERLDLNLFPIPNYSDFDTNEYMIPNGIISEFSRGCVAKCTFCEETHFWNYRQRGYMKVVDELEHLNKHFGFNAVWFVDSLLNGNLTELKLFAEEIIKRGLKINWFGYGRHDKRMDLEYLKLLKESGLVAFQYGSESGSNKVLEDMKKRVTKEEMEQNFIDGAKVGIQAVTGWVIGFPTETINDFVDTMTLVWRNRNTSITNLVVSQRFHMGPQTIVGQNPQRFGILPILYDDCYIREDFTLGKPQLLIRSKTWNIFQEELKSNKLISHLPRPNLKKYHYEIKYLNHKTINNIEFETFDYNIVNTGNPWQDSCINQPFGFFRFLWRTRGGFEIKIKFDYDLDLEEFGPSLACNLKSNISFSISNEGKWEYLVDMEYTQMENSFTPISKKYLSESNVATVRARKLANPTWGIEGITDSEYQHIKNTSKKYNEELNLSFDYKNKLKGEWSSHKKTLF